MDNFILNWTNKCKNDDNAVAAGIICMATELKNNGYNRREAKDMLLSQDMDIGIVDSALNNVYIKKARKVNENTNRKLPTSYEDMQPFISTLLHNSEPEVFVNIFTASNNPIIKASGKNQSSLLRLVKAAKESPTYETSLHNHISMWVEEELLRSVESAEKINNVKLASELKVDTKKLTCSCEKFVSKHYAELGLVCEHIIKKYK